MDSPSYIDENLTRRFGEHRLSKLHSKFLEPVRPGAAIDETARLAQLLLLSNHLDAAHELLCVLCDHADALVASKTPRGSQSAVPLSEAVLYFWAAHEATHARPASSGRACPVQDLARAQWGKYRECCRTGWMLHHCQQPEPEDVHVWRESDDPTLLAMCCRLLAKNKTHAGYKNKAAGAYPPPEAAAEALEAAKTLFGLPEEPVARDYAAYDRHAPKRHAELLYRRLGIELAIRAGELETAAGFMSDGLVKDGFRDGGQLENYLFIPGIYDVLPLLASRGKSGNPFYIEYQDAVSMVAELRSTIELRAREGRQWSLAPEKVGWRELLDRLAEGAWKVNEEEYLLAGVNSAKEVLFPPASEKRIKAAEKEVGPLPPDFREMVSIANGFQGGNHLFGGGISGITDIALDIDDEAGLEFMGFECDAAGDFPDVVEMRAGFEDCDGFRHYYVPPAAWKASQTGKDVKEGEYLYWHGASWAPGGYGPWSCIRDWVAQCVEKVEGMVERGGKVGDDD